MRPKVNVKSMETTSNRPMTLYWLFLVIFNRRCLIRGENEVFVSAQQQLDNGKWEEALRDFEATILKGMDKLSLRKEQKINNMVKTIRSKSRQFPRPSGPCSELNSQIQQFVEDNSHSSSKNIKTLPKQLERNGLPKSMTSIPKWMKPSGWSKPSLKLNMTMNPLPLGGAHKPTQTCSSCFALTPFNDFFGIGVSSQSRRYFWDAFISRKAFDKCGNIIIF